MQKYKSETWLDYSERLFGLIRFSDAWCWCFDLYWVFRDNTPEGAAFRIEWLLKNGLPKDCKAQMHRTTPLCYK